ncbi:MAG: hypothetical protein KDN20_16655 [Verrucomicrobiae bacterium]|nr:hypothetical protein [Verrucomicrobiae bacterium]
MNARYALGRLLAFAFWCAVCLSLSRAQEVPSGDFHTFTGPNGTTLEAEVLEMRGGLVVIRRVSDGQIFELPANRLAPQDVDFMRAWLAEKEASKHPLDWKRLRVHVPEFVDKVEVPGIPAAFRRIDLHTWEADLPEGAWVLVKLWREGGADFAPQFLLPFAGEREWFLTYESDRLSRSLELNGKPELIGVTVGADVTEEQLRTIKGSFPSSGVSLYSGFMDAADFSMLRGATIFSLVVTKLPDFSVARDGGVRALRVTQTMGEMSGLDRYDELEFLEIPVTGAFPLATCGKLKALRTLITDGDVTLEEGTKVDGGFPALRHLSLWESDLVDRGMMGAFLAMVPKLQSLVLPDFQEIEVNGLANCPELTAIDLGNECVDSSASGVGGLPKLSIALLNANYTAGEMSGLADGGKLAKVRVLRTAQRVDLAKVPSLKQLMLFGEQAGFPLSELAGFPSLPGLEIRGATDADIAALGAAGAKMVGLNSLILSFPMVTDLTPLATLPKLEWLRVSDQLLTFDQKLTTLDLSGCAALRGIELERLQNLTEISLGSSPLEAFTLRSCDEAASVKSSPIPSLSELVISNAKALRSVGTLMERSDLKVKRITGSPVGGGQ